jgi:hypothetical protein
MKAAARKGLAFHAVNRKRDGKKCCSKVFPRNLERGHSIHGVGSASTSELKQVANARQRRVLLEATNPAAE